MTAAPDQDRAYRITSEPVAGRVRVAIRGTPVADATDAVLVRETYRPPQYYFPKSALLDAPLRPSPHRTFCPFRGTAEYWDIELPDGTVTNAAWSYEKPLEESRAIGGYVAFAPGPEVEVRVEPPAAAAQEMTELIGDNPLVHWLLLKAWQCRTPAELTEQFAQKILALDIPLWRLDVNLWALHPELAGRRFTWTRGRDGVVESDTPHGILKTAAFLDSPVRYVSEGLGGVRQRLDVDEPDFRFPIFEHLKAEGGTDYVAMPLPFSDGQYQTLSLATDSPQGFATADLGLIFGAVFALARFYEVLTLRGNAQTLFATYLGRHTGRRVLGGQTRRGDGENIRAAILFCDLRDSTALSESLSREAYLELLNDFFERAAGPVLEADGEVLKFIGDAVLAIFPLADEADEAAETARVCRQALGAANEIIRRMAAAPSRTEGHDLRCGIGLHFGDVTYGNVGAPGRLDFTVIGTAANIAARLSTQCKALNQPLLVSAEIARCAPGELSSVGRQVLHNVGEDVEAFVPAGAVFG
jgi:adenylate cyclase